MADKQLFVVIAYDGTDSNALNRRMSVREDHLKVAQKMKAEGTIIQAGALLDNNRQMIGSMLVVAFESHTDLDAWLATDPYVTGQVWQKIVVHPFQPAPL